LEADDKTLTKLAKKMKKNNVAIDIINFGEESENTTKLEAFINAVNSGDNCHLITIPPGPHILSDMLFSTSIIAGEDGAQPGFATGGGSGYEFGVDPNMDPELALALRISLEEARQAEAARAKAGDTSTSGTTTETAANAAAAAAPSADADDDLQAALAMSRSEGGAAMDADVNMGEDLSEEEQIARAIALSMQGESQEQQTSQQPSQRATDMEVLSSVLGNLPGVDPNDPRIQSALHGLGGEKKDDEDKEKDAKKGRERLAEGEDDSNARGSA